MERVEGGPVGFATRHHPRHGIKRTHRDMATSHRQSVSPLFVQENGTSSPEPPPRRQHVVLPPLIPSIRDRRHHDTRRSAYDHRRPISTMGNASTVIDLTEDDATNEPHPVPLPAPHASSSRTQRLPRFDRDIIDLEADSGLAGMRGEEDENIHIHRANATSPDPQTHRRRPNQPRFRREASSDVIFVEARPRSADTLHARQNRPPPPDILDIDDMDDEVVITAANERPGINQYAPLGRGIGTAINYLNSVRRQHAYDREQQDGLASRLRQRMSLLLGPENPYHGDDPVAIIQDLQNDLFGHAQQHQRRAARPAFMPVGTMDYDMVNFGVGPNPRREPTPQYRAPPALPEGFTGSPKTDEIVVCPSCGDELATGQSEEKRQVWAIKACGHVYCGGCMANRKFSRSKNDKGKGRADQPPLRGSCLIDGCTSRVGAKQVLQVFL